MQIVSAGLINLVDLADLRKMNIKCHVQFHIMFLLSSDFQWQQMIVSK